MTAFRIEADARQVEALAIAWRQAPELVIEELTPAALEASLLLEREVKEGTPAAAGTLRESVTSRVQRIPEGVLGITGTALSYAIPVELGTRPHMPPVQPIIDWAKLKLGVSPEEAERVGYAVARTIALRGTPAFGMFHRAFAANRGQVERIFERAARRIVDRLAKPENK